MRKFIVLAVVLVSAALVWSQQPQQAKKKSNNYLPLQKGNKWHYRVQVAGKSFDVTTQVSEIEKVKGQSLAKVDAVSQGKVVMSEHLRQDAKGVFRHRVNGIAVSQPVCVLKYPIMKGDSWKSKTKVANQEIELRCRVGKAEVTVPAGKYKAVTVEAEGKANGQPISTTYWFAPNVGIVKQTIEIGGTSTTMELVKFEQGK